MTKDPMLSRRQLLKTTAAGTVLGLTSAGLMSQPALAADATVGFIYVGPKDDYGYNQAHAEGAAALKGIPAFLVARKIYRLGTDRYISGENIAGIDKDTGKILEGGAIAQAARRIRFRLKKIRIKRK